MALDAGQAVTARHYAAAAPAAGATFIIAHGAGAGQHSPFMVSFASGLAALGVDAVTFNFLYTEQQRRLPDRAPALEACYGAVIRETRSRIGSAREWLFIGGKSMGGRIATQVAAADATLPVAGLVLLGYPLHPPGRPEKRRDAHLPSVRRPMLVIQGSRDAFGTPDELRLAFDPLVPPAELHLVEGGDHSFTVARAGAARQVGVHDELMGAAAAWMRQVMRAGAGSPRTPA
ncbi:MAG TPA: alpha/beta family hydrolase [Vicinamibacterales bacterium]|nr:alpha/beta family hydrolase [Vicinamibacterales bacterium]